MPWFADSVGVNVHSTADCLGDRGGTQETDEVEHSSSIPGSASSENCCVFEHTRKQREDLHLS
eukprot:1977428-Rhodomonas_salina.1